MTRRPNPKSETNKLIINGKPEDKDVIKGLREISYRNGRPLREIIIPLLRPFVHTVLELGAVAPSNAEACANHPKRKPYARIIMKGAVTFACRECYQKMKRRSEAWQLLLEKERKPS